MAMVGTAGSLILVAQKNHYVLFSLSLPRAHTNVRKSILNEVVKSPFFPLLNNLFLKVITFQVCVEIQDSMVFIDNRPAVLLLAESCSGSPSSRIEPELGTLARPTGGLSLSAGRVPGTKGLVCCRGSVLGKAPFLH